jgi:ABC-type phosphate/phosphonate transport system ATPase subunit
MNARPLKNLHVPTHAVLRANTLAGCEEQRVGWIRLRWVDTTQPHASVM